LAVGTGRALAAETAATINTDRVNARARPSLFSEVVAQLRQDEGVTVVEVIKLRNSRAGEPAAWAKIRLPARARLWVSAAFVDADTRLVKADKLNVRVRAGENASVVGALAKGDAVEVWRRLDHWLEIGAPSNSWAFVSTTFLSPATPPAGNLTNAPAPLRSLPVTPKANPVP
jgi:uncharacterized protein YgiM (DUF1202 family)